ncbi:MAG: gliding motility protein GldL, partial [Odoribacter sp.]|nr:gliding motility protein GldL [Odoribacter sp.]
MKIFESKAYKSIMGYVNGWGASVVIVGALFKIMHFPGASIMLIAGMLVEAFIFFLSAFEPPMEHYDWSRVFPELGKHD